MAIAPRVGVFASGQGVQIQAPRTNAALELANSLAGISPELNETLSTYATKKQADLAARAHRDALSTSGAALADAVREGKLEPTQNPWYVQAYEKESAEVRTQAAGGKLLADSQLWTERNDPAAFTAKFNAESAKLGEGLSPAGLKGFEAAIDPLRQQAIQSNIAQNVSRITQERSQNISTLNTTAILQVNKDNGGSASPDQVYAAMEPQKVSWLSTGGTEQQWNELVINSVIAAAANSADPGLLDVLQDDRKGKGPLANIAGPDGTPVAQQIMQARYRIEQEAATRGMSEMRARDNAAKAEGLKGVDMVYEQFGYEFIAGNIPGPAVAKFLQEKGLSPRAAAYAISQLREVAVDYNSLAGATSDGPDTLKFTVRALKEGMTPDLESDVFEAVAAKALTVAEGKSVLSKAASKSQQERSEARSDARQARSDSRQERTALRVDTARELSDYRDGLIGNVAVRLQSLKVRALDNPAERTKLSRRMLDAERNYRRSHPDDVAGQRAAASQAAAQYYAEKRPATKKTTAPGAAGDNPLRKK